MDKTEVLVQKRKGSIENYFTFCIEICYMSPDWAHIWGALDNIVSGDLFGKSINDPNFTYIKKQTRKTNSRATVTCFHNFFIPGALLFGLFFFFFFTDSLLQCPCHLLSRSNSTQQRNKRKNKQNVLDGIIILKIIKNTDTYIWWNKQHSFSTSFWCLIQS